MTATKSNQEKIEALFETRRKEIEQELERMDTVKEMTQMAIAEKFDAVPEEFAPLDMDTIYNKAAEEAGVQYGTDAQMVLDYILRHLNGDA